MNWKEVIDKKPFAILSTTMPNGSPKLNPVWVDREGDNILINSLKDSQEDLNMRSRPRIAIIARYPDNSNQFLEIQGEVIKIKEEHAEEHIDKLASKYLGVKKYPFRNKGDKRATYVIKPKKINLHTRPE